MFTVSFKTCMNIEVWSRAAGKYGTEALRTHLGIGGRGGGDRHRHRHRDRQGEKDRDTGTETETGTGTNRLGLA